MLSDFHKVSNFQHFSLLCDLIIQGDYFKQSLVIFGTYPSKLTNLCIFLHPVALVWWQAVIQSSISSDTNNLAFSRPCSRYFTQRLADHHLASKIRVIRRLPLAKATLYFDFEPESFEGPATITFTSWWTINWKLPKFCVLLSKLWNSALARYLFLLRAQVRSNLHLKLVRFQNSTDWVNCFLFLECCRALTFSHLSVLLLYWMNYFAISSLIFWLGLVYTSSTVFAA